MALAAPRTKKISVGFGYVCGRYTHTTSGLTACLSASAIQAAAAGKHTSPQALQQITPKKVMHMFCAASITKPSLWAASVACAEKADMCANESLTCTCQQAQQVLYERLQMQQHKL